MNATTVNQFATRANALAYAEMLQRMGPFEAARIQREE